MPFGSDKAFCKNFVESAASAAVWASEHKKADFPYPFDPEQAEQRNIFDSHCHLDRLLSPKGRFNGERQPFTRFKQDPANWPEFGSKFSGCITSFCDPWRWVNDFEEVGLCKGCQRFTDFLLV